MVTPLISEWLRILEENKKDTVAWVGDHPGIPLYYDILNHFGYHLSYILDNDENKQGRAINSYVEDEPVLRIEPVSKAKELKDDVVYFMANTHTDELKNQLTGYGVSEDNIYDFFELTDFETVFSTPIQNKLSGHRILSLHELLMISFRHFTNPIPR